MNRLRYFDKPQLLIAIIGVASLIINIILYIIALFTAEVTYKENGVIENLTLNPILQSFIGMFSLVHLTALVWFIARSLTYKMRVKENDAL